MRAGTRVAAARDVDARAIRASAKRRSDDCVTFFVGAFRRARSGREFRGRPRRMRPRATAEDATEGNDESYRGNTATLNSSAFQQSTHAFPLKQLFNE